MSGLQNCPECTSYEIVVLEIGDDDQATYECETCGHQFTDQDI